MILGTGFLIAVDRGERGAHSFVAAALRSQTDLHATEPVVAQVWRNGSRQARLASFLGAINVHPMDDGRAVGALLAHSGTADVVDAHLVVCAVRLGHDILTGDPGDLGVLAAAFGPGAPTVHAWP